MDQSANHQYPPSRNFHEHEGNKDQNKTPRDASDPWGFTPSILDTNSFAFTTFANQPPNYYTPTPGGMNTAYHNQAGDLHTPGMGFQLGTPLSLSTSEANIHTAATDLHGFHPHMFDSHFQTSNHFAPQQSYAPSSFLHREPGFEAMGTSNVDSPPHEVKRKTGPCNDSSLVPFTSRAFESSMPAPPIPSLEK